MAWKDNQGQLRTSGNAQWVLPDNPYPEIKNWEKERRNIEGGFWNSDPTYPYQPHSGVDYGANKGERVTSYDSGEVLQVGWDDVFGYYVFVYHPKINKTTLYAHLTSYNVTKGQHVNSQQEIGKVGNTGSVNGVGYGDHLHIGIQEGRSVNMFKDGNTWYDFDEFNYSSNLVESEGKSKMVLFNAEEGNFKFTQRAHVLDAPNWSTGNRLATYEVGEQVIFEGMTFADDHTWLFYTKDGQKRYVPIQKGTPYGNFV